MDLDGLAVVDVDGDVDHLGALHGRAAGRRDDRQAVQARGRQGACPPSRAMRVTRYSLAVQGVQLLHARVHEPCKDSDARAPELAVPTRAHDQANSHTDTITCQHICMVGFTLQASL